MKKKIFMITMAALIVILSIASASMAYFTDVDSKTNVFTAGNVDIALTYENELDANQSVYPSQNFDVDATITNIGSETAYVGAIITLTNAGGISSIITPDGANDTVAIEDLLVGLSASAKYREIAGGYEIYVVDSAEVVKNGKFVIFTDINFPSEWNHAEMNVFKGTSFTVKAYATQAAGFENGALDAITKSFVSEWENYPNP